MSAQTTNPTNGSNGNGTAAMEKAKPSRMDLLKQGFADWRSTLKAVLPKHIDPDRVIKIAMNVYLNKPELQSCTPLSMIRATLQAAELGLEPSPLLGEAWFIPFKNTKKVKDGNVFKDVKVDEVQLIPGYVGLVKLAKQTGEVADVYAVAVDECESEPEYFQVFEGTERRIHHVRRTAERTGNLFAVYAVVKFKDGTNHFEVLSKSEVDAVRKRSKSADSGPWVTDYVEMAKKTAIKRALKTVPKSPEKPQLAQAIATDNAADIGEAFSTDLAAAIDVDGVSVPEPTPEPKTRTDELASRLGATPAHDPKTGEVR